jgi:formiminoglutamate deiminase
MEPLDRRVRLADHRGSHVLAVAEPTTLYWCELAWLGGDAVTPGVTLEITGDRITQVETNSARPSSAVRLHGLTLPAMANAHSHAFHRALRGRTHAGRGSFWSWRELMYQIASMLDPDSYYELARAVYAEMVMAGIGVVGEFHYVHHQPDGTRYENPNAMGEAITSAATDVGIRLTLLDTLYLHGGFGSGGTAEHYAEHQAEQARFSDGSGHHWSARVDALADLVTGSTVQVGGAIHSVRAVDPAAMAVARKWADSHDSPLHVHVSEQPAENEQCAEYFGCTA